MWFLIKGTFWFSMVLVLLSYFGKPEDTELAEAPGIEIGGAIAAATGAYSYISSICIEKPDVCIQGAETLNALGQRAKAGALVAYQILDEKLADGEGNVTGTDGVAQTMAATVEGLADTDILSDAVVTGTVAMGEPREPLTITVHVPVPRPRPGS